MWSILLWLLISYVSQSIARAVIRLINLTYVNNLQLWMIYHSFHVSSVVFIIYQVQTNIAAIGRHI